MKIKILITLAIWSCSFYNETKAQTTSINGTVKYQVDENGNIFTNGKLAIGTTDTLKIGTYSLAVNGDAIFNKVKVKSYASWSDYVFYENYQLLPLKDLETFIRTNYHLPGVPSANEVEKNGIDLADDQAILLKKVEELTLYIIEQQKQIGQMQHQLNDLKPLLTKTR